MSASDFVDALRTRLTTGPWPDFDGDTGTDVDIRVTGVRAVDDGPWPEVEIAFDVAPRREPARSGVLRRPIDPEWRRLSLYDDPDRYATRLAADVALSAWRLPSSSGRPDRPPRPPPSTVPEDVAWDGLLASLAAYGEVREAGPGRIEVTRPGVARTGVVLNFIVTPEQWAAIGPATTDEYPVELDELIGPRAEDEVFFVFHDAGFHRSVRAELPAVRGTALQRRLAAMRAADPEATLTWTAG